MKVLLIEDDLTTAKSIQVLLCSENIICDLSESAEDALHIGKIYDYDGIILDLCLPDINGHDLLRKLRDASIRAPIIVLSGLQSVQDKVRALGYGADDYMTKPFNGEELVVRLKALSRRAEGHSSSMITVGEIEVNLDAKIVKAGGVLLQLTGKEYQVMELLALRKGATVGKHNFLNRLYSGLDEPELKIIDVFVFKLRKKLEEALGDRGRQYISTVWGRGYVMREPSEDEGIEHTEPSGAFEVLQLPTVNTGS